MSIKNYIRNLFVKLNIPMAGQIYVETTINSAPSRPVKSNGKNVCSRFASEKMGHTVGTESHSVEFEAAWNMEFDDSVIEFWDQPEPLKLNYISKNGRKIGVMTTPDFLVIKKEEIIIEEWKTEEDLIELAISQPTRYIYIDGNWRSPPGEEAAAKLGLKYRLRISNGLNPILQKNIKFLADYIDFDINLYNRNSLSYIYKEIDTTPFVLLSNLLDDKKINPDIIFTLISGNYIYVDLESYLLSEPHQTRVYKDKLTAEAYSKIISTSSQTSLPLATFVEFKEGNKLLWDNVEWDIITAENDTISLCSKDKTFTEIPISIAEKLVLENKIISAPMQSDKVHLLSSDKLLHAAPGDLKIAVKRHAKILPFINKDKSINCSPTSSERRWIHSYNNAEVLHGSGFIGLLPKFKNRGNYGSKLTSSTLEAMNKFIEDDYETLKQKTKSASYILLQNYCDKNGVLTPSYKTYAKYIKKRSTYEQTLKRKGRRAAYRHEPLASSNGTQLPSHAVARPFEECHIDHTELDIELISEITGQSIGRPWLTVMIDIYSRRIVAMYLTFENPSYRSCMMILRECVKRYNRFPSNIVVDNGKEFNSIYFETLLARYVCHKKSRPPAKARFGAVDERFFNTINTQVLYSMQGNTQITKNVRVVTKSNNPKNLACWTFRQLNELLSKWAHEVYDTTIHATLGCTPKEMYEQGVKNTGLREHKIIPYDHDFIISTMPSTKRGKAKVQPNYGVKINYFYYWADSFRHPEVENTTIPIKFDPFNVAIAYAYVNKRWVKCISQYSADLTNFSEKDILLATAEIRRRAQIKGLKEKITGKVLRDFLIDINNKEETLRLRKEDMMDINISKNNVMDFKPKSVTQDKPLEANLISIPVNSDITTFEVYDD